MRRQALASFLTLMVVSASGSTAGGRDAPWWAAIDDSCFLFGSWSTLDAAPAPQSFELTFIGQSREGRFRVLQFARKDLSLQVDRRLYGYYRREGDLLEAHYCDPCLVGSEQDHVIAWDITDMGSLETNYPSEMTLVSRGGADVSVSQYFKPLLSGKPVRLTRTWLGLDVRDMFPEGPDLTGADTAEHDARLCALTSWARVRPRRY